MNTTANALTWLTREQVKDDIVRPALKRVADFDESQDWTVFGFSRFHTFHKWAFINEVAYLMNIKGYDIFLSVDKLKEDQTVGQFIDYIRKKQRIPLESREPKVDLQ